MIMGTCRRGPLRTVIAALPLVGLLMLPAACSSGHAAWCGQTVAVSVGFIDGPTQTIRVDASHAGKLSEIVSGSVISGSLQSSGNGIANAVVLTVPADFPALIRRDAVQFNGSGDDFLLYPIGFLWNRDFQKQCR